MTRSRDLSGFGGAPQPKRQAVKRTAPKPKAQPKREPAAQRATRRQRAEPSSKSKRITLSLPTEVADVLKAERERDSTFYLDIILDAFVEHSPDLVVEHRDAPRVGGMAVGGRRKRRPSGRTQIPLVIPEGALREIDGTAKTLGLDRSAFVTALLERAL